MSNRVAFVTGGAQGIGQGISETLGANGLPGRRRRPQPGRRGGHRQAHRRRRR